MIRTPASFKSKLSWKYPATSEREYEKTHDSRREECQDVDPNPASQSIATLWNVHPGWRILPSTNSWPVPDTETRYMCRYHEALTRVRLREFKSRTLSPNEGKCNETEGGRGELC